MKTKSRKSKSQKATTPSRKGANQQSSQAARRSLPALVKLQEHIVREYYEASAEQARWSKLKKHQPLSDYFCGSMKTLVDLFYHIETNLP